MGGSLEQAACAVRLTQMGVYSTFRAYDGPLNWGEVGPPLKSAPSLTPAAGLWDLKAFNKSHSPIFGERATGRGQGSEPTDSQRSAHVEYCLTWERGQEGCKEWGVPLEREESRSGGHTSPAPWSLCPLAKESPRLRAELRGPRGLWPVRPRRPKTLPFFAAEPTVGLHVGNEGL